MRWQLVDRIEQYEPWSRIDGRKTVSLEEYLLLEPFGLRGEVPTALVLGSLVQLVRWLVAVSSDFETGCTLAALSQIAVRRVSGKGTAFSLSAGVSPPSKGREVEAVVKAEARGEVVCSGALFLRVLPLSDLEDPEEARAQWAALFRAPGRRWAGPQG